MAADQASLLPALQRLALAYAPAKSRPAWIALLALDARLADIVRHAHEPMLAQLRLAWWREQLAGSSGGPATGDPLLALLREWPGQGMALAGLAGGWEAMTGPPPLPSSAFLLLAEARGQAFAALADSLDEAAIALRMGRAWALADGQLAFCGRQHVYMLQGQSAAPITMGTSVLVRSADRANSTLVYSPRRKMLSLSLGRRALTLQFRQGTPRGALWDLPDYPQAIVGGELVGFGNVVSRTGNQQALVADSESDGGTMVAASWRSTPVHFGTPHLWKLLRRAEVSLTSSGRFTAQLSVGETFGDGSPDYSGSVQELRLQGGKWDSALWDRATWGQKDADLRVKLSVPSGIQGNYLRFRVDLSTLSTSNTYVSAPITCEYRSRERLGRT